MSTRSNLCENPTCSVSSPTSGDSANYGGTGSGRVTALTGFPDRTTGYRFAGAAAATHAKGSVTRNTAYTYSTYVKPEFTGNITAVNINWYVNGAYYSTTSGGTAAVTSGSVTRVSVLGTSPNVSGTIQGLLNLVKPGTLVSAQTMYELGSVLGTYGDGDSSGGVWLGTTGLSASTFTSTSVVNVFPTTATMAPAALDPSIEKSSSSPTSGFAAVGFSAQDATIRVIGEGPPLDLPPDQPEPVWTLYVRNSDMLRAAQIDDYSSLSAVCRFNDVGTWELALDYRAASVPELLTQGAGIEIRRDDFVIMTGPVTRIKRDRADSKNLITVSGVDDNVWLNRRVAHPQPASTAPPYSTVDDDIRTGVGSTIIWQYVNVNLGPGAISPRQLPTLTMATDPVAGSTVTGNARYDILLELIQDLAVASGDLAFRIQQIDDGLEFQVYTPEDKSGSVVFSEGFGNISEFSYEKTAPEYTYVYGGGDGEGKLRTVVEGSDSTGLANWGRIERLVDARQKDDGPTVSQQISTDLAENSEKLSLDITPIDTPNLKYGEHYQLGDKVSVVVDGVVVSDLVRQVEINLTAEGPQKLTPVLGTPGRSDLLALFSAVRDLASRTRNLERR